MGKYKEEEQGLQSRSPCSQFIPPAQRLANYGPKAKFVQSMSQKCFFSVVGKKKNPEKKSYSVTHANYMKFKIQDS